jgi:hypothetical protein
LLQATLPQNRHGQHPRIERWVISATAFTVLPNAVGAQSTSVSWAITALTAFSWSERSWPANFSDSDSRQTARR